MNNTKYVIISPVRDEAAYIEKTLACVASQTVLPVQWILVDDGSSDRTAQIIDDYAQKYVWITALHRADRGSRVPGSGVMEAFYFGYQSIKSADWEYIVKLDGDLGMEPDYFEKCLKHFHDDPTLGMGGGMMYFMQEGVKVLETHPRFHVRGPTKIYRRECWDAIGGLIKAPGWDTVDELKANMLGWRTYSFPELTLHHYRPTGAAQGAWKDAVKNGRANYISGYHPLFMMVKCFKRIIEKPYFLRAAGLMYGFFSGYFHKLPRVEDPRLIKYVRDQQLRRLLLRKSIWH